MGRSFAPIASWYSKRVRRTLLEATLGVAASFVTLREYTISKSVDRSRVQSVDSPVSLSL